MQVITKKFIIDGIASLAGILVALLLMKRQSLFIFTLDRWVFVCLLQPDDDYLT